MPQLPARTNSQCDSFESFQMRCHCLWHFVCKVHIYSKAVEEHRAGIFGHLTPLLYKQQTVYHPCCDEMTAGGGAGKMVATEQRILQVRILGFSTRPLWCANDCASRAVRSPCCIWTKKKGYRKAPSNTSQNGGGGGGGKLPTKYDFMDMVTEH